MAVFNNNVLAGASGQTSEAAASFQVERSLRFNSADTAKLTRSPSTAGNRRTWTWSAWVKRASLAANDEYLFGAQGSGQFFLIGFLSTHEFFINPSAGVTGATLQSNAKFRDPSAWYHIVVAVDTTQATASDRVKVYVNGDQITSWSTSTYPSQNTDWHVNNNVSHSIGASTQSTGYVNLYMAEIHHVDGTQLAASDFGEYDSNNVWQPKDCQSSLTYGTNGFYLKFDDNSSNAALGTDSSGNSNTWTVNNLVAVVDEINASSSEISNPNGSVANHLNLFDGDTSTTVSSSDGGTVVWTPSSDISISKIEGYFDDSLNGYRITMSVSGGSSQTITVDTSTGGTANQWNEFGDLAGDTIGPSNAITFSMLRPAGNDTNPGLHDLNALRINDKLVVLNSSQAGVDSLIDTPMNYTVDSGNPGGNYATLNPLQAGSQCTLSNGNLDLVWSGTSGHAAGSTIAVSSGKWYVEFTVGAKRGLIGIIPSTYTGALNIWPGNSAYGSDSYGYYGIGGNLYNNSSNSAYGASWTTGDVIGIALDLDAGNLVFYKNGSSQGTAATGLSGSYIFAIGFSDTGSGGDPGSFNFGQRSFAYTPPSNHLALCTTNLTDPTIADGSTAMDIVTYDGNATTNTAITGLNHSPNLLWIKSRSSSQWHFLADTVRGNTKNLASNAADGEETRTNRLLSFDSNGFTIGNNNTVNENNSNFVAWAWNAGTGSAASNTDGSITSSVRANQTAGISIVSYEGSGSNATVGHGLNAAPSWILVKNREATQSWQTFHVGIGNTKSMHLNTTDLTDDSSSYWQDTDPTSSVFSIGTSNSVNQSSTDFIAYCFAPVTGFSS